MFLERARLHPMPDDHHAIFAGLKALAWQHRVKLQFAFWGYGAAWKPYDDGDAPDLREIASIRFPDDEGAQNNPGALAVFAHELGHHLSWLEDRSRWNAAVDALVNAHKICGPLGAIPAPLTADQFQPYYAEEVRAWQIARALLAQVGATDFAHFDSTAAEALRTYRENIPHLR